MVVHQVLCKGTQGSKALIRDTLRPEDNPRVVGEGDGDDREPEQAAPLKVSCTWRRPHRCSDSAGLSFTPGEANGFPCTRPRRFRLRVTLGIRCRRHLPISARVAPVLPPS